MSDDPGFDTFWSNYPRKVAKGLARRSWASASRRAPVSDILSALAAQIDAGMFDAMKEDARRRGLQEKTLIPHPSTWLCADRWEDEIVHRTRPAFRNGALELLAREHQAGVPMESDVARIEGAP
jgi:hypothetical protein